MTRFELALLAAGVAMVGCSGTSSTEPPVETPAASASTVAAAPGELPIGDGRVSTSGPRSGYVWSCQPGDANAPGAAVAGPWITGDRWSPAQKIQVHGDVDWPTARYSVKLRGDHRVLTGNRLPVDEGTGVFPIQADDPAYRYDTNPNAITAAPVRVPLPRRPHAAAAPTCLGFGGIGLLNDGVLLFDALDAQGRDAVAHEVLDRCDGHPAGGGVYHHHDVPTCLLESAPGAATLVGYAFDGYGIYVERDEDGELLTNADLDACHGRTSVVPWDGKRTRIYHYVATAEYPYVLGCFHAKPVVENDAGPPPGPPPASTG